MSERPVENIPFVGNQFPVERFGDVTASNGVPSLLGVGRQSPAQLWAEHRLNMSFAPKPSAVLRRGNDYEELVAALIKRKHGRTLRHNDCYWRMPGRIWPEHGLGCTPDYFDDNDDAVIEIKTVAPKIYETHWRDGPPPYYVVQVLVQLILTGRSRGYVACWVMDPYAEANVELTLVEPHEAATRRVMQRVDQFWESVEKGVMPPMDYAKDAALIAALYPQETKGSVIDLRLDNRMPELLAERVKLMALEKDAHDRRGIIDNEIKDKMGVHESALVAGGWRVTFKSQTRKAHSVAESTFRNLRVTPPKEDA